MLILECSQGCYGRTGGSVTISLQLRNIDIHEKNVRENRRDNQVWTIQRRKQHWVQVTEQSQTNKKYNINVNPDKDQQFMFLIKQL